MGNTATTTENTFYTRKDYLDGKCTHFEYYAQFVTDTIKSQLLRSISKEEIKNSTNPHFNDIKLEIWDMISISTPFSLLKQAGDSLTLAGKNCILKAAAQIIKSES